MELKIEPRKEGHGQSRDLSSAACTYFLFLFSHIEAGGAEGEIWSKWLQCLIPDFLRGPFPVDTPGAMNSWLYNWSP